MKKVTYKSKNQHKEFEVETIAGRPTKEEEKEKKRLAKNKKISETMSKLTPENIQKLEASFALDCSIGEICFYCDISPSTLLNWREKNPELFSRLERLRDKPILKARQEVVKGIENDKEFALKYLSKKKKAEFSDRLDVTTDGEKLPANNTTVNIEARIEHAEDLIERFNKNKKR